MSSLQLAVNNAIIKSNLLIATLEGKAYKLAGKTNFRGLPISIETKKGQVRKGVGADGKPWKVIMPYDYGYIRGTEGADGQHVDCFIGPNKNAEDVYVIHQCKEDDHSKYDEDKVMLGFDSLKDAIKAYKSAYVGVDLFKGSHTFNFTDFCDFVNSKKNKGRIIECTVDWEIKDQDMRIKLEKIFNSLPEIMQKHVEKVVLDPDFKGVHGQFDDGTIKLNPNDFTNERKYGQAEGTSVIKHVFIHECAHSVYDNLDKDKKEEWRKLSNWKEGQPEGNAEPYVEKREGWPDYTADVTHSKDAEFPNEYSAKNDDEDFADCASYYLTGNGSQLPQDKLKFMEKLLGEPIEAMSWEEEELLKDTALQQLSDEELNQALLEEIEEQERRETLEKPYELHSGGEGSGWFADKGHVKHVFNYPKGRSWKNGELKQETLNGVKLKKEDNPDYGKLVDKSISEPAKISRPKIFFKDQKTGEQLYYRKHAAAGVVVVEPDNKLWLYTPKNYFGGYVNTFSKGTVEKGEHPQDAAVRELHEETGLVAKIKGYLGDVERNSSVTRYYIGERVGGHPGAAKSDETDNVQLVPIDEHLVDRLKDVQGKDTADVEVLQLLQDHMLGKEATQETSNVNYMQEKIGSQAGSNKGGFYKGSDGVERYVKFYKDPTQGREEATANTIYNDLGIGAPKSSIFKTPDDKEAFASEIIKGGKILQDQGLTKENSQAVLKGFAADVLTANWDAVGLVHDNILMKGGDAYRIDNGAAFTHRAQGASKPSHLLNDITEWKGLNNPSVNGAYSQVFKKAGYKSAEDIPDIKQQVQKIVNLQHAYNGWENYLDKKAPYLSPDEKEKIGDILTSRTELMQQKVGIKGSHIKASALIDTPKLYRILAGGPGSGWFADNGHVGHGSLTTYKNLKKAGWKPKEDAKHPYWDHIPATKWIHPNKPEYILTHEQGWHHYVGGMLKSQGNTTVQLKNHLGMQPKVFHKYKQLKPEPLGVKQSTPINKVSKKDGDEDVQEHGSSNHIKVLKNMGYVATNADSSDTIWKQPGEHFDDHFVTTNTDGDWKVQTAKGVLVFKGISATHLKEALSKITGYATTKEPTVTVPVSQAKPATVTGKQIVTDAKGNSVSIDVAKGVKVQIPAVGKLKALDNLGYSLTSNKGEADVYTKPGEKYAVHIIPTDPTHSKFDIVDQNKNKVVDTGTVADNITSSLQNIKNQELAGKAVGVQFPQVAKADVDKAWHTKAAKTIASVYSSYEGKSDKQKYSSDQIDNWKNEYINRVSNGEKEGQATLIKAAEGKGVYAEAAAKLGISPNQVKETQSLIENWTGSSKDVTRKAFNDATQGIEGANPGDVLEYHITQQGLQKKYPSGKVSLTRGMYESSVGLGKQIIVFKALAQAGDILPDWSLDWKSGGAESWTSKEDNGWGNVRVRTDFPIDQVFSSIDTNPKSFDGHPSEKEYIVAPKDYHWPLSKKTAKIWSEALDKLPSNILNNMAYLQLHGWRFDIDYTNHVISFQEGPDIHSGISNENAGIPTEVQAGGPGSGRKKEEMSDEERYQQILKKPWNKQTEDERLFVAHHNKAQMRLKFQGGGPGSGWTEENGHISHRSKVSNKSKIAKKSIANTAKENFTVKMQSVAEGNEQILAKTLGGKSYNDTEPTDIVVRTSDGRLIGLEVKTLLYQKNSKITMNHGAIPRKEKWQRKTGGELYTVAIDNRDNKSDIYVRKGVGSWKLEFMVPVKGGFNGLKKFLEIGKTLPLSNKFPKTKEHLGLSKDHKWTKPSKRLQTLSVLDSRVVRKHVYAGGPESGWTTENGHISHVSMRSKKVSK